MTVIDEIAAERARQIHKEGWTPAHDDGHRATYQNCPCGGWDCTGAPEGPMHNCPYVAPPRS